MAEQVVAHLMSLADEQQTQHLMRFFKTDKGDYGEGDKFLGIKVPVTRRVVTRCKKLPLSEIETLLASPWHEVRLCGLLVLVAQFEALCTKRMMTLPAAIAQRDAIVEFYLGHASSANNWDLVDLSVYKIVGEWLMLPSNYSDEEKLAAIDSLAVSDNLWEQRMSMVCTLGPLMHGDSHFTLRYAERHLNHPHDLMHKAVGWMLREMGKRVSVDVLRDFLHCHAQEMPRTALRYAIERLSDEERKQWMTK
jgi:3-methyladenine DNA glycosylase AlkD